MSGLSPEQSVGVLRNGWSSTVGDYAIAGDWACNGELLVVGDAAGGVYGFDGKSGTTSWQHPEIHDGGLLAWCKAIGRYCSPFTAIRETLLPRGAVCGTRDTRSRLAWKLQTVSVEVRWLNLDRSDDGPFRCHRLASATTRLSVVCSKSV